MAKLNKKELKELRQLVITLPITFYDVHIKITKTGEKVLSDSELTTMHDKVRDFPRSKFTITYITQRQTNHYKRLKELYYKNGMDAVHKYYNDLVELYLSEKPIELKQNLL